MNEESLFAAALGKSTVDERQAFLDEACAGDARLRQRLALLLAADEHARGILDRDRAAIVTALQPGSPLATGQVFADRYLLREKLGEGGMGEVWVADQQEPVRRRVAVKVIRAGLDSTRLLGRFEQERQTIALMDHPNIGKILDAGVADAGPYFIMEVVDGRPITRYCDEARLSPRQRLELFVPVCQAVQHAHSKGVIHRDLKPANILVPLYDGRPVPKVIDFGIAKATGTRMPHACASTEVGILVGTLEYMSPEQAETGDHDIDTRSDIYALGVLLHELLTGAVPFSREQLQASSFSEMLRIIKEVEPPRPSARLAVSETLPGVAAARQTEPKKLVTLMRGELDWIVMKCLEKDRNQRYETANALVLDVQRYLADEPVLAGPPTAAYRARRFLRRHRGAVLAASLVLLALVGGVIGTTIGLIQAVQARQDEQVAKQLAEQRLAQVEKGIDLLGTIFEDLDPMLEVKEGRPLRAILGDRLDKAAAALDGETVGDPLVVARLQERLGQTYLGLGHAAKAETLFTKAVATRQAHLGARDPLTLVSMHNLAMACWAGGKAAEAIRRLEQVRDDRVEVLGADHLDTLSTLDDLGVAYWRAAKAAEAIALLEKMREARVKQHGADDPRTHITLNNLAGAYLAAGRRVEAARLAKQVLEVRVKQLGQDHPLTIASLNNLAYTYQANYKMREALALFEQAREAIVPKLGPDHPRTLLFLDNLARIYRAFRKPAEAIALAEQVREKRVLTLGARHPATLFTLENLALAYRDAGRLDKAIPLLQQAAVGVEMLEFAHDNARTIIDNLCTCHERLKQYDQAEVWRRKWLDVVRRRVGPESTAYGAELAGLASNVLVQKRYADAESILRECLAIHCKMQPETGEPSHLQSLLGAALLGQKRFADAEPLLVQGYQGMKDLQQNAPHHGSYSTAPVIEALGRLVQLYDAWGKPDDAAKWRKELDVRKVPAKK